MAFNEILIGRINRYCQKLLQIKNTALRSLAPDLQLDLPLQTGSEDRYLQDWQLYNFFFSIAAQGAGNISQGQLRNPSGSGLVAVVYQVVPSTTLADTPQLIVVRNKTTDFATTTPLNASIDARASGCSIVLSTGSAATVPVGVSNWGIAVAAGNTQWNFLQNGAEVPILPGDALVCSSNVANQGFQFYMSWRVRRLESSELT